VYHSNSVLSNLSSSDRKRLKAGFLLFIYLWEGLSWIWVYYFWVKWVFSWNPI